MAYTKHAWMALGLALGACGGSSAGSAPAGTAGSGEQSPVVKAGSGASTGGTPASPNKVTPDAGAAGSSTSPSTATGSGGRASEPRAGAASPGETGAAVGGKGGSSAQAGSSAAGSGERFSFFVTSFASLQRLSKSQDGFGGDLRYGEADGLTGADKICREIAESSLPGAGQKTWRAFLSVTKGADGNPVHAIDRIGAGPWYDRLGRLLALDRTALVNVRPQGGDPAIINDFPNEDGVPNHAPDGAMQVDNHDMLTGTGTDGKLFSTDSKFTCQDWTSAVGADGTPRVGHSWPRSGTPAMFPAAGTGGGTRMPPGGSAGRGGPPGGGMGMMSGDHWMSALTEAGCAAGANLVEMGGPMRDNPTVGSGGGYGGFYCFALTP